MQTKARDLKNLSENELVNKQESLYQELYKLNQQRYAGRVDKPHLFKKTKKEIARIKTILNEKRESPNNESGKK